MKRILPCICVLALVAQAEVTRKGDVWEIENRALKVSVQAETAWLSVLEKESGALWQQEDPARQNANQDQVRARRASTAVSVDGNPAEWAGVPAEEYVWLPWMGEHGESNCSAGAKLMWDDKNFYLYVRVRDDKVAFGGAETTEWWEADSVEFWIDSVQVGLHLAPAGHELAVNARGEQFAGSVVAVRMIPDGTLPGYELEVAMPLHHFPVLQGAAAGIRFSFAIGLNDADPEPGAPVKRDRQSYSPRSWVHSAPTTFAVAVLTDAVGDPPERTRDNDRSAGASGGQISEMKPGAEPNSLSFHYLVRRGQSAEIPLEVVLRLVGEEPFLDIDLNCLAGAETALREFNYPPALYPQDPESYFMGVANYTNGRYLPVGDSYCRNRRFSMSGGDLPFVLVTDGGRGLATIMLTPCDAAIQMQTRTDDPDQLGFPGFRWYPQKSLWGENRRGRLAFFPEGGHVAACKIYRKLAVEQGLVRTFREKEKRKPDVRKLFGAVNWWGAGGLSFVREAVAAGMTRGLLNGRPTPPEMSAIIEQGWLVGEYDNYEDINDAEIIARAKAPVKEHAVVKADGEFMTAWITRDKDMKPIHTYMKQCTGMMTKSARVVIPKVLEVYPYNTRFLDVTTATGLKECYSTVHGVTRTQDQRCREQLCAYVGDELGLVAGGEHGRYWDVPYLDYHEGMMGGGQYTWPAGYLRDVKSREEIGESYLKYGIDPANRVPMFELVFHDCVVNYWYWGACSDFLHQVAPELTDRKTAMNVLYGTPPMMWARGHGLSWGIPEEREKMLEIYRNVCKLHEVLGDQEMISHAFLTPDRQVQQTTFSDGTVCTVNFAAAPYKARSTELGRDDVVLRLNDFVVKGPQVEQWRLSSSAEPPIVETFIRTNTCLFVDFPNRDFEVGPVNGHGQVWATLVASGRLQISLSPGSRAKINLGKWSQPWRKQPVVVFGSDASGRLLDRLPMARDDQLELAAGTTAGATFTALIGDEARKPDLTLADLRISVLGKPVAIGAPPAVDASLDIEVTVQNQGLAPAHDFAVTVHLDSAAGPVLTSQTFSELVSGGSTQLRTRLSAAKADGARRIVALVEGSDAISMSGRLRLEGAFTGAFSEAAFPHKWPIDLEVPSGDAAGLPVETPFVPGQADAANLRVRFGNGTVVPAQFEPTADDATKGNLVFVLPAGLAPGAQSAIVLGASPGSKEVLPHTARFEVAEDGSQLRFDTYSATLTNGVLGAIAVRDANGSETMVASQIIVSSKETGWSREEGEVELFGLQQRGPVRAVFACTKLVSGKFQLVREWHFYGDRFEVSSTCTPAISSLNRALYSADAVATNEAGRSAVMDGKGEGEEFGFNGTPQWYALVADSWRNACLALTESSGITYWDSGPLRGQISLDHRGSNPEKRVYIWGTGAVNDDFAKAAAEAYATGVKCR